MRGEIRRFNILFVVRITKCGLGHLLGPYLYAIWARELHVIS